MAETRHKSLRDCPNRGSLKLGDIFKPGIVDLCQYLHCRKITRYVQPQPEVRFVTAAASAASIDCELDGQEIIDLRRKILTAAHGVNEAQ